MAFVTDDIKVWAPRPLIPFHERSSSCKLFRMGRSFPTATAPTLLTLFLERFRCTSGSAQSTAVWTISRTQAFPSSLAPTFSQDSFGLFLKTWMSGLLLWGPRWFPLRSRETRLPPPRAFARSLHPLSPMRLSARLIFLIEYPLSKLAAMASAKRGPMPRSLACKERTSLDFCPPGMRRSGRGARPKRSHTCRNECRALLHAFRLPSDLTRSLAPLSTSFMEWYILKKSALACPPLYFFANSTVSGRLPP